MANIPLQDRGQFIQPAQKRGVSPDYGNAAFAHARSIVEGFDRMGRAVGNDLVRVGKAMHEAARDEEQTDDAYSLSMWKIREVENFSRIEAEIDPTSFSKIEDFDAHWERNVAPEIERLREATLDDGDVVWNRSRLEKRITNFSRLNAEALRAQTRGKVLTAIGERRKSVAVRQITTAGENGDVPGVRLGADAAVAAGVPLPEVETAARSGLITAFSVIQRQEMEKNGGVNSVRYKLRMREALSDARDAVSDRFSALLGADVRAILDAWERQDFEPILAGAAKKRAGAGTAKTDRAGTAGGEAKNALAETKLGGDFEAAREAGLASIRERFDQDMKAIDEAKRKKIITPEDALELQELAGANKVQAEAALAADIVNKKNGQKKEMREFSKSMIAAAAEDPNDDAAFLALSQQIAYSGTAAREYNENLQWLRDRAPKDYDARASANALLRIYANAGRFSDEADADGMYRLSALALARRRCNPEDYAKAVSFLAGGLKDSVHQATLKNGTARLFAAAGLKPGKMDETLLDDEEKGALAAACAEVAQLAGQIPKPQFDTVVEDLCGRLRTQSEASARIRYLNAFLAAATRDVESVAAQRKAEDETRIDELSALEKISEQERVRIREEGGNHFTERDLGKTFAKPFTGTAGPGSVLF